MILADDQLWCDCKSKPRASGDDPGQDVARYAISE